MLNRTANSAKPFSLAGAHVLVLLPPSRKERTVYMLSLFEAAKERWNWRVSGISEQLDEGSFKKLTAPDGIVVPRPYYLRDGDWASDPALLEEVDADLAEAEAAAAVPIGQAILAGAHSAGRAYNVPFRYANQYPLVRQMLSDNLSPFRLIRRLFKFSEDTIGRLKPDIIIAYEWATPLAFATWLAANARGIPCVALRNSKILPDCGFWTLDRRMFNTRSIERAAVRRAAQMPVSEQAKAQIAKFRDRPSVINYIAVKWHHRMQRDFLRWHAGYVRVLFREMKNSYRGQDTSLREPWIGRLYRYYRRVFFTWYHSRFMVSLDEPALEKMKFVYFPMHKEAELAQTFQSTLWHDQRNTIRVLASMLPSGYRLLVREHRMNYGNRPTSFYRQMARIPNLTMIDAFDSQFKYLRHADLVVTENGSSGLEGLLLRRRVLKLAQTFYDGAGLGRHVSNPDELNAAILDLLGKPAVTDEEAYDHALGCMIDAERDTTFRTTADGTSAALDLLSETLGDRAQR